jgi:hypothetical protein
MGVGRSKRSFTFMRADDDSWCSLCVAHCRAYRASGRSLEGWNGSSEKLPLFVVRLIAASSDAQVDAPGGPVGAESRLARDVL